MNKRNQSSRDRKSGQAIIFLIMVIVIGSIVLLWNFDLHNIVSTKIRVDNAGDAAALSAARWQGITLNMIGELNLSQAAFICEELSQMADPFDPVEKATLELAVEDISLLRKRLALTGPLMGMVAAQASAIQNLTEKDERRIQEANSRFMAKRGQDFLDSGGSYMDTVDEPYDGAWKEYGGLLSTIANNTMLVECANAQYFMYYTQFHHLLDPGFYRAVAGRYWCYFSRGRSRDLIDSYVDYNSWDTLPPPTPRHANNSEYFSTDVWTWTASLGFYYHPNDANQNQSGYGYANTLTNYFPDLDVDHNDLHDSFHKYAEQTMPLDSADLDWLDHAAFNDFFDFSWHYFEQWSWLNKSGADSGKYFPDSRDFPFHDGWGFRDEYNYGGADAAVDVRIGNQINTPGLQIAVGDIYWQSSAKTFGYLEDPDNPSDRLTPVYYGLVLPAFHDTRLIHNDLSTRKSGVDHPGYDEHIYEHLPEYIEQGLSVPEEHDDCWYCKQLIKWEDQGLREAGRTWLDENQERIDAGIECRPYRGNPNMGRG